MGMFDGVPPEYDLFGRILSDKRPLVLLVVDDEPLAKVIGDVMEYMDFKILRCDTAKCTLMARSLPRVHLVIVNVVSSRLTQCGLPTEFCGDLPNDPVLVCGKLEQPYPECDCHAFFLKTPFNVAQFAYGLDRAMAQIYCRGFSNTRRLNYRRSNPIGEPAPDTLCSRLPPKADREISVCPRPGMLRLRE
jgi:hypothetical protein